MVPHYAGWNCSGIKNVEIKCRNDSVRMWIGDHVYIYILSFPHSISIFLHSVQFHIRHINIVLSLTRNKQIQIRVFQVKPLTQMEICQCSLKHVNPAAQMNFVPDQVVKSAFL